MSAMLKRENMETRLYSVKMQHTVNPSVLYRIIFQPAWHLVHDQEVLDEKYLDGRSLTSYNLLRSKKVMARNIETCFSLYSFAITLKIYGTIH